MPIPACGIPSGDEVLLKVDYVLWQGKDIGMEEFIKALFTERKKDIGMEDRVLEAPHPTGGGVTVMLNASSFVAKTARAPKDELKEYGKEGNGEDGAPNLLALWKLNDHRYLVLATLAKEILGDNRLNRGRSSAMKRVRGGFLRR